MNAKLALAAVLITSLYGAAPATCGASDPPLGPPPVSVMRPSGIEWKAGVHYEVLNTARVVPKTGKVEVLEFFQYGCPGCYTMEPHVTLWKITFENLATVTRVPVMFRPKLRSYARLYYTLGALGRIDERGSKDLNHEVFDHVQRVWQPPLTSDDEAENLQLQLAFATARGIDATKFTAAYRSQAVERNLQRAAELAETYRITSTPTFIVGGKYKTDTTRAGDEFRLMRLLMDLALLARAEQERAPTPH
jgi:thiol:disulfide interchange protein DsbA